MAQAIPDTIRTLAYTGTSGSYASVGAALTHNWRIFKISNNTDGDMLVSLNASTDNFFVPAGGFTLYDLGTNAPPVQVEDNYLLSIGTQFSIKRSGAAPTKGAIWIEGFYAKGE